MTQARIKSFFNCDTPKKWGQTSTDIKGWETLIVVQAVETAECVSPGKANRHVQAKRKVAKGAVKKKSSLSLHVHFIPVRSVGE